MAPRKRGGGGGGGNFLNLLQKGGRVPRKGGGDPQKRWGPNPGGNSGKMYE